MSYQITIDGSDRTNCVVNKTVKITDESRDKPSTMKCIFFDKDEAGDPSLNEEVIVTKDSTKLFAGKIVALDYKKIGGQEMAIMLDCMDYTYDLDRNLVVEGYEDMTDKAIIEDIIANYCQGTNVTTNNVDEGVTINQINFNYMPPSQCFRKICDLTGRSWYIDYDKDVHYFTKTTNSAPWDIDSDQSDYKNLEIEHDNSNIRNRVYVRGGTYLSDSTTIKQIADGVQTVFLLPAKPTDFSMKEGGVSKTVGIKNVDDPADYDYLLSYQEKYVEEASGTAPSADTEMEFTFKYEIPVLVAVEDKDSIESIGQREFAIFDNKIEDLDTARDRAQAELTDYADSMIDGSFETNEDGFRAGQYINVNLSEYNVNDDYMIQKVSAYSLGGGEFVYTVSIVSATKLGIINFLIKMLENDKNFLDIDPDEVVDELFEPTGQEVIITDSIVSDSLITPPYEWGSFKWGLAEWS